MSDQCKDFHDCEACAEIRFTVVATPEQEAARMIAAGIQNVRVENGAILFSWPDEDENEDE